MSGTTGPSRFDTDEDTDEDTRAPEAEEWHGLGCVAYALGNCAAVGATVMAFTRDSLFLLGVSAALFALLAALAPRIARRP